MALYPIDRALFDLYATRFEAQRQHDMRSATTQAAADAIHCVYFQAVIGAGKAFKIATLNEQTAFAALGCQQILFTLDQSEIGGPDVLG